MLRLTHAPNIAIAALWLDALQQAGYSASMQRYFLSGIAGELPPDQCLPEIWLTNNEEETGARALLDAGTASDWRATRSNAGGNDSRDSDGVPTATSHSTAGGPDGSITLEKQGYV